jgi:uncharacterized protein (PEP-CTERM system associated)
MAEQAFHHGAGSAAGSFRDRRLPPRALGIAAAILLAHGGGAAAFPLLGTDSDDQVPSGTELSAPDAQDLRHQLQIVNGLAAPAGGGWTIVPRIDAQEMLTDNVLQVHNPRQWDLVTYFAPGINIAGDLPRAQLVFSFAPTLSLYARTSSLNSLTQSLNGVGSVTVVPDLAFVDVRAVSGVHSQYGGLGGLGGVGAASAAAFATPNATIPTLAGNNQGLTRDNEVQTTSYGVSPYLLRRFGDWGTGKLGYSIDVTRSDQLAGFASLPVPSGGTNGQTLVTNEQIAHFATGDILEFVQDSIDIDLSQSQSQTEAGFVSATTGLPGQGSTSTSTRETVTDQVTWQLNRSVALFVSGGHENIVYSGTGAQRVDDFTWSFGTTLTPNPDSSLTLSYGHQNGFNSFSANGHYAATARTLLTVSYGQSLGTQLQYLQSQLNLATTNGTGGLVNAQNGGGTLFNGTNALAVADGVFRTETVTLGSTTTLDRDAWSVGLSEVRQAQTGTGSGSSSDSKTASVSWQHTMRPDMTLSAAVSYSLQTQSSAGGSNPGNNTSVAASVAWQYQISDTVSTSLRYSFLSRTSAVTAYNVYQNLLILGLSKSF